MHALTLIIVALLVFALAYRFYAKFIIAKILVFDPKRATPAHTLRDGKEVGRVTGAQSEANYRARFEALSNGGEVKIPLTQFDRMLRLGEAHYLS